MGAVGAMTMAFGRRRLNIGLLKQALDGTAKLATFVLFILVGSTVFSFTFNAADGHVWVEHLFDKLPGGALGFLIVVNILVFILGCFIDFFEIAFIVIPILVPVAEKLLPAMLPGVPPDAVMIWFGVIIAMNLQTSFLTPPFGFALFYLRSVAAKVPYIDKITGKRMEPVTTGQIYYGSIPFVCIQVVMVGLVIAFPAMVMHYKGGGSTVDPNSIQNLDLPQIEGLPPLDLGPGGGGGLPGLEPPAGGGALPGLEPPAPLPGLEPPPQPSTPPPAN